MKVKHAMILAAGLGTRMKPLTLDKPKPLIKVGNKNLLERSINLLESYGVEKIIINVHHLADQIEKFISVPLLLSMTNIPSLSPISCAMVSSRFSIAPAS